MKLYCPLCKKKVEVKDYTERIVQVNHGQRRMVEGKDSKGHNVAQFISMNPKPEPIRRKRKKREKRTGIFGF